MKPVTNKMLWLFAVGQFGWSLLSGVITNWLVFFYQPSAETVSAGQTLFITQGAVFLGLTVLGLITAVCRIFDAVTDPWVASLSDRCKSKAGRRIPFLRGAALPFAAVTVLVFMAPVSGVSLWNNFYLLAALVLFYLFLTLYCTPFNALIPELGKTPKDRINVSTYISVTFFLGTGTAYLLPNVAGAFAPRFGYVGSLRITVAIFAVVALAAMLVPALTLKEAEFADTTPSQTPGVKSLVKTFRNKEFQTFVKSDILYWIALTIFQTGLPFYITVLMKLDAGMSFVLFALMTLLSLVFYVPVNLLAKKWGKKKLVSFAFLFFSAVFLLTTFSGMAGFTGLGCGLIVSGLAAVPMAVLGILPQAVVADIAEADAVTTHENREGMFYAARTFAFKLGQSAAMLIFTALAGIGQNGFGYRVSAVVAAVLCLAGGLVFLKYHEDTVARTIAKE
ncbi:MAG: MFS transporter [Faecalibacterium sp.]|jgi:GPH family glycoside/pentoside/hexuronide:cation symporter|nr:MFS transporter [Faecalibacterium sp.]